MRKTFFFSAKSPKIDQLWSVVPTSNYFTGQKGVRIDHNAKHFDGTPSLFVQNE